MASRPWEHFTAFGDPVDPDVNSRTISDDGSGRPSGGLEGTAV
jgi:hypothetical protein